MSTQDFIIKSFLDPHPGIEILKFGELPEKKPVLDTIVMYHKVTKKEYIFEQQAQRPSGKVMYLVEHGSGNVTSIKSVLAREFLTLKLDFDIMQKCQKEYPQMKITTALMHMKEQGEI